MAFIRNINDFILTLVALSLPSIAATLDCNGKPFHCLNSTHFMICVDFGSGVSSTMDDFVIPCPPTTVCQATNRFECEFPTVTTTTSTTITTAVTNSPLAATVDNDVVIDTVSDVTTIPFEEYFNTISTTTLSEGNLITRDVVTPEIPVDNLSETFNVSPVKNSNINESVLNIGVSSNSFTTQATLDMVTEDIIVTERMPNITENVIFKPNSNISEGFPNSTEIVPTDIDLKNLNENNTVDVTENYETNSTLLETIIGATNFRQFNTSLYNSSHDVTEPIFSETTQSTISIPTDHNKIDLIKLDKSPDTIYFDNKSIENVTASIPTKATEYYYNDIIQSQSNSTLNTSGDTVLTTLDTVRNTNGSALNVSNSDSSVNEITTKFEEQISTVEPILFETMQNVTINIPVYDKHVYFPTTSPDVLVDDQTIESATKSLPAETITNKSLIESQSNHFNNLPLDNSSSYDITESILPGVTENIINIPVDDKQDYLSTIDASLNVVVGDQTIDNETETLLAETKDYKGLLVPESTTTLYETVSDSDIAQNDATNLNTVLNTNESALNVNNSDSSFNEITTKFEEQISTVEPILFETMQNVTINIPVYDKHVYLPTKSPDVFLDDQTIDSPTKSLPAETTTNKRLIESQINHFNNLPLDNSSAYDITEPMLTGVTESITSIPVDDKQNYLTTPSPDVFLGDETIDSATKSILAETTPYKRLIESQSNRFNTLPLDNSNSYDITEPILPGVTESIISVPVDKQDYLTTPSPNVFLDDETIDSATKSIPAETTTNKRLIDSQSNRFNNLPLDNSSAYDITEPILPGVTESITSIPVDDKQDYLSTNDASLNVVVGDQTIDNETEIILAETTDYNGLLVPESRTTLYESVSDGDSFQNEATNLNTNESALNVNNSDSSFNEITTKFEEKISTVDPILYKAKENTVQILADDKQAYLTTLDVPPDVILNNNTIKTVTESLSTETTEYRHLIENQSNSPLNANMASGDIKQNYTITVKKQLNTNGSTFNVHNYNLTFIEENTRYEEQISTAHKNFESSDNTVTVITEPDVTERTIITKPKPSVSTITENSKAILTNSQNVSINTDAAKEITESIQIVKSRNNTNIFDNAQTSEFSFKDSNHYLSSTEASFISALDNTSVKKENNESTTQSEDLTSVKYVENVTKKVTRNEDIHILIPKPPRSNETTIFHSNHSTGDIRSTTNPFPKIDTIIGENKTTTLNDISARTDEAQRVIMSEVYVNYKPAETTENNNLLPPVIKPTSTSNIEHTVIASDLTNEDKQETSIFINKIEFTATGNVTNEPLMYNVIDMNNSTDINVTSSNHIEILDRIGSVSIADYQINTGDIPVGTPNDILETVTQEVNSFTYSNLYHQTDIEEIGHDERVPRNNILSADTIESTSSMLAMTTKSTTEPHFDSVLQVTTSFTSFGDKMYTAENDNYFTSIAKPPPPNATPSTAFDSINSAIDSSNPVTRNNEVNEISTRSSKLEMTPAINENAYISTQQTIITSSRAFVNKNNAVDTSKQVTKEFVDENISREPSILQISSAVNETHFVATEQNIPSVEVSREPADLIPDKFKYTTSTDTANDSVNLQFPITIAGNSSTAKSSKSPALSAQKNREIKETLQAITTSNTATDSSAIPNSTVSNLSDVNNFEEEINYITVVDSLVTETTVDDMSKASTDNVLEKYPISINKEDINTENIRKAIKIKTTTEDVTATENIKQTELLPSYSNKRENISQLEIKPSIPDEPTLDSFISDDVNYTENQKTQDRVSNTQAKSNIPDEISPEGVRENVYDPNYSINEAIFIDGLTINDTAGASDTKLTHDVINQHSTDKSVAPKIKTTEMSLTGTLNKKDVLPVKPDMKTNLESIIKTPRLNGDINANPIITTETSNFESHTERKSSLTTSIQDSKYVSNLALNTESWRATVVTKPVVYPTRLYTETLIKSSNPNTKSNDYLSQDLTSVTPKQYINFPQTTEGIGETKRVLDRLEPPVISLQATESSGIVNQDFLSSPVSKSTIQKSQVIDTFTYAQNQRVTTTEKHDVVTFVTPPAIIITKPVDLSMRQTSTAPITQISPEYREYKNDEQIEVPTIDKEKINALRIISPNSKNNTPLVNVDKFAAVPISNLSNISKDVPNGQYNNSNSNVQLVPKPQFKPKLNTTSTTDKIMPPISVPDIVMVNVVKTESLYLENNATGSNKTHSGILAIPKSTSQQVKKHKASTSVVEDEEETEKEEKPEVPETNSSNEQIEQLTLTEGIPIKKQANVQHNPSLNTKQISVQNVTTRTRPIDSHVENTTAHYNTKTKSSFINKNSSKLPASETSKHSFVCKSNNRGRFSDNGDCRKFYICIGKHEPIKGICPNNTVFSELRKQCTKNLSHCVRNNQFQCVSEGRFSDYLNDNIYYICVNNKANRFIRFKLQCQNGYHLNKTSVRCVLNTESIQSNSRQSKYASDVSSSNQSVSTKSEKIKEKPKSMKKFECKRSGRFPEPNDCRKYYVCTKLEKSKYRQRNKKCDSDEVYNRDKKKCVDADSYECS